jgi:GTP-binding protein
MFFDEAKIFVKAGDGGNGCVAFRREKFIRFGGPFGGNGGKGGDIYLEATRDANTLVAFSHQSHFRAGRGVHGGGKGKTGAQGDDTIIPVPRGTVVYEADTGELLGDLVVAGQRLLVGCGGRGGRGNMAFKSATNQAPRIAEHGEPGEARWIRLELKLIADVGIVGVPNAGKSTLLSVISRAKPKIADYPFTTLEPNLGVVVVGDRDFVAADIPGLIEGAHTGAGLGHQFLRHIERTRLLIHLLNGISPDPLGDFEAINQELELFNPELAGKLQIVVFNKMDLPEARLHWHDVQAALRAQGIEPLAISAATGEHVQELLHQVIKTLDELPVVVPVVEEEAVFTPPRDEKAFTIVREADGARRVRGVAIERAAAMTNWDYYEAAMRFQRILSAMGILDALTDDGIDDGDLVRIGDVELTWGEEW